MVVVPADTPVTEPDVPTVATPGADDDQVPPEIPSARDILLATHTDEEPVMAPAFGAGLTVMFCVAYAVPQLLVTA